VSEFPLTNPNAYVGGGLVAGPDGAVWFADQGDRRIGRITTTGVVTEYPYPSSDPEYGAQHLTVGPDGALWVASYDSVTRVAVDGTMTVYPLPDISRNGTTEPVGAFGIAAGPDGALWFTEQNASMIGRIMTSGVISTYGVPTANAAPYWITPGPDGAMWFTEFSGNQIGRITVPSAPTCALTGIQPGPPKQIQITVQDTDSGLSSITATQSTNATVNVPPFTAGTTSPVVVTATKIDQNQPSSVTLQATNGARVSTVCDPRLVMVRVSRSHRPRDRRVRIDHLAYDEHWITIANGRPGLSSVEIKVNRKRLLIRLKDGQIRRLDVTQAMERGSRNTIVLIGRARDRSAGSADIAIWAQ
jgi:sugar lactone lactonase YvrE